MKYPIKFINFSYPFSFPLYFSIFIFLHFLQFNQNILSEITFFKHHTICLTITDPFAFSLNGTVTVHGFSDYASLTSFEQNNVLLLPKKTYNEDTFEYEFCTTSMISFEDDREYLLPEEYLLQNSTAMPTETAITIESDATTILNNLNETCSGAMLEMSPNKTSKNIYCDKFVFAFFYFANLLLFKG